MTKLKKIALNLDCAKDMLVPAKRIDDAYEASSGVDGFNAKVSIMYVVTYYDFCEAYSNEFPDEDAVNEKLQPGLMDKTKKMFGGEADVYRRPLWETFENYVVSNAEEALTKNLGIVLNGNFKTACEEVLAGQGIHLTNGLDNLNVTVDDVEGNDEKLTFTVSTEFDNLKQDEDDMNMFSVN